MAQAVYPTAEKAFLDGDIDLLSDDIRVILVDSGYTYSSAHDFLNDVGAGSRVATSGAVTSKSTTAGKFTHAATTFAGVTDTGTIIGLIHYQHTGNEATARLVHFADNQTNMPLTPSGNDIIYTPDGTNGVFYRA